MSLTDCIPQYEYAPLGPPTTEWELSDEAVTDKFRKEFPDGVVPIRFVPTLGVRSRDAWEWGTEMLSRFEAAQPYDIDRLDDLGSRWLLLFVNGKQTRAVVAEKTAVAAEMLGLGLTIKQLAAYLHVEAWQFAESLSSNHHLARSIIAADELLSQGVSAEEVGRRCELSSKTAWRLAKMKKLPSQSTGTKNLTRPDRDEVLNAVAVLYFVDGTDLSAAGIRDVMFERFPSSREWLTRGIVHAEVRMNDGKRGRKRVDALGQAA